MRPAALILCVFTAVVFCVSAITAQHGPSAPGLEAYRTPDPVPAPPETPLSSRMAELGRMLFFDRRLSGPGSHACATCHNPSLSWADGLPRAIGEKQMALRSPSLIDVASTDSGAGAE